MKKSVKLSPRLEKIAKLIKSDVIFDIGTDHGYIPVYAVENLGVKKATASDIAVLPLQKAEALIKEHGLCDKISTVLSDGPDSLNIVPPCDVVIAGMGGELISSMIERCLSFRKDGVRLILQPMTKSEVLRKALYENGFNSVSETVVFDGKLYEIIVCVYDGIVRTATNGEYLVGKKELQTDVCEYRKFVQTKIDTIQRNADNKKSAEHDVSAELLLIDELKELLK